MINLKAKYANVLFRPRITEKGNLMQQKNIYVFEIAPSADKKEVKTAIRVFYGITPLKVAITKSPSKKIFFRGKRGRSGGVKKAYVYLKKGDTIDLS